MSWAERIARARSLATARTPSSDILTFYADLADYQRSLATLGRTAAAHPTSLPFASAVDVDQASRAVADFLRWLQRHAPSSLAREAAERQKMPADGWRDLMLERLANQGDPSADDAATAFVVETILQPFAERAAGPFREATSGASNPPTLRACPTCGGPPVVGALREEGHGARRVLICGLCASEWSFLRVQCPVCEESRFDALPVYTADTTEHVRVDACDSCRTYIKTVDLTKDGLAVPIVDDLATLPLDLWARDRGYRRLYPNLLRL